MAPKCRYPKDLGLNDFLTFVKDMVAWIVGEVGKPDYRASVVAGFDAKVAALEAAIVAYSTLQSHVPKLHLILDEKAKAIQKALQSMKTLLPVFFADPAIVGEFGLALDIKLDNDDLYVIGQSCLAHWGEVSADPEFAEVVTDFAELQTVFDEFVAAREGWVASDQALDEAQNTILAERATVEEHERNIFNYYRAKHPDPKNEWWTDSPWGRTGESGEPSPEIGVPGNLQAVVEGANVRISWDPVEGAEGYFLVHTLFPPLFLRVYEGEATEFLHEGVDAGVHHYMVRARVGEEFGEYSAEATTEVVLEPPAPPVLLVMTLVEDNKTKVNWANPNGTYYDGCNLYVADVPTGSPEPPIPASPMFHDLFVYSVTLGSLAPGTTRYAWVTGVRSGVESAPAGPVWVSV